MAPRYANQILWKPAGRDTAEQALFADGIIYLTRGDFDLSFRAEPTDEITLLDPSISRA